MALAAILLATHPGLADESPSLLQFDLRSLEDNEVHSLERFAGKPVLLVLFQPDCSWCLKQFRAINDLHGQCDASFEAIAIGFRGNRSALREELRRLRPNFPAYQASPELLDALGGPETTPISLLGDEHGRFVNWFRGYADTARLRDLLAETGDLDC